jgi:hypothetical protein
MFGFFKKKKIEDTAGEVATCSTRFATPKRNGTKNYREDDKKKYICDDLLPMVNNGRGPCAAWVTHASCTDNSMRDFATVRRDYRAVVGGGGVTGKFDPRDPS